MSTRASPDPGPLAPAADRADKPIAILGGTFDPVHVAHLRVAWEAAEALDAEVRLMPANVPPHRPAPVASAAQRVAMLEAALAGQHRLTLDTRELRRDGASYTFDTLRELRGELGATRPLLLLLGADAFAGLPGWHRWRELFELAHIVVLTRPGHAAAARGELAEAIAPRRAQSPAQLHAAPAGRVLELPVTPLEISASAVRALRAAGREPRWLLPEALSNAAALLDVYRVDAAGAAPAAQVHADARLRSLVLRCAGIEPRDAGAFSMEIHPHDQMFTHSLREHGDTGAALSQYFNVALQQHDCVRQILDALLPAAGADLDVLDFACGYGRLLRFLTLAAPPPRIVAAELQADALAFVARAFGVETLASHADPERFATPRRFDFIWVASLFTHLPEKLFVAWLGRLQGLLSARGVLCFSVRDAALLPPDVQLPAGGILYQHSSENAALHTDIYGTTYASEAFVARALAPAGGAWRRLPRALANEQDIYVWCADAQRDFAALGEFRRGVWGWVDRRRLSRSGELYLEGWAASQDDGVARCVEIRVGASVHRVLPEIVREDVGAAFGDARLTRSGWALRSHVDSGNGSIWIEVLAHGVNGAVGLLYAGQLHAAA